MKLSLNEQSKKQVFKQSTRSTMPPSACMPSVIDNKETREDIVSEVFASLWNNMDNFENRPENDIGLPQDVREEQLPELPEASGI